MAKAKKGKGEAGETAPTPRAAAKEALAFMKGAADEEQVATLQRYFKDPIRAFGVDYKAYKEWRKGFGARLKKGWSLQNAVEFCEIMLEDPHMESRGTGFWAVGEFIDEAGPERFPEFARWLGEVCDNWGCVDGMVPTVLSPLVRRYPELAGEVKAWTGSENQWVRRGAAVAFVTLVDDEEMRAHGYEIATRLQDDGEDLTQKAVGWMLREAGKVDRDELEAYLLDMGPKVPRTTLRYAIEKFPKADRKRIMEATKG
jgi:3-methyladenine DNA glycosylase AlkD